MTNQLFLPKKINNIAIYKLKIVGQKNTVV